MFIRKLAKKRGFIETLEVLDSFDQKQAVQKEFFERIGSFNSYYNAYLRVKQIMLDPFLETADVETGNNYYPPRQQMNRFELYKRNNRKRENPMQRDEKAKKKGENNK
jgi:hypothetical protein